MAETRMLMVFCYDVSDAKARRRLSGILEDRAVRVQESVFEALLTPRAAHALFTEAASYLMVGDSLRLYAVTAGGRVHCRADGGAPLAEEHPFYLF